MDTIANKISGTDKKTIYYEKIPTIIYETSDEASNTVAHEIATLIKERAAKNRNAVLGLATGSTPVAVYDELVRLHQEEGLSFKNVITFNLDEYYPMNPDSLQRYFRFMKENLFDLVDIPKDQIHIPDGTLEESEIAAYCQEHEEKSGQAGGIDMRRLGISRTGPLRCTAPG